MKSTTVWPKSASIRPLISGLCLSSWTTSRGTRRSSMSSWRTSARTVCCPGRPDTSCTISPICSLLSLLTRRWLRPATRVTIPVIGIGWFDKALRGLRACSLGTGGQPGLGIARKTGLSETPPLPKRRIAGLVLGCWGGVFRHGPPETPDRLITSGRWGIERIERSGCGVDGAAWCGWAAGSRLKTPG